MEIADIANLETAIEMRREILRLAVKKHFSEDYIWKQVETYRATHPKGKKHKKLELIGDILRRVIPGIGEVTISDTPIEEKLKVELEHKNIKFESQKEIGRYKVDFFFPKANLVVEADGKDYHSSKEQQERDEKRDCYLMKKGYTVVRFPGSQIFSNIERVVAKILTFLED